MYKSIEEIHDIINEMLQTYCDPKLISPYYYSSKNTPPISFKVAYNQDKHIIITFNIMSGPFGENIHTSERIYYNISFITQSDLINHFFHSVTYDKSPYLFNRKGIINKQIEVL